MVFLVWDLVNRYWCISWLLYIVRASARCSKCTSVLSCLFMLPWTFCFVLAPPIFLSLAVFQLSTLLAFLVFSLCFLVRWEVMLCVHSLELTKPLFLLFSFLLFILPFLKIWTLPLYCFLLMAWLFVCTWFRVLLHAVHQFALLNF